MQNITACIAAALATTLISHAILAEPLRPAAVPPAATEPADAKPPAVPGEETFEPFPGGIADPLYTTAYVVTPGGTLDAVDLKTGKQLWASAAPAYPLLIDHDRIYALSPTSAGNDDHPALKIIALSIKGQGKCVFQSKPIEVEEWIAGDPTGKNFGTAAKLDQGKLLLTWGVSTTIQPAGEPLPMRGRRLPRSDAAGSPQNAAGNVKLDLATGNVEIIKDAKPLVTANRSTVTAFDGREYKLTIDADKGSATLTCVNAKTKKALWDYSIEPGAVNAAKTNPPTPGNPPAMPMPYMIED